MWKQIISAAKALIQPRMGNMPETDEEIDAYLADIRRKQNIEQDRKP